jgi:phosphatidylglycerophosphatase A
MHEGTNEKPQKSIWDDVIAWLFVLLLVFIAPFVIFFVAIFMGFMKISSIDDRNRAGSRY